MMEKNNSAIGQEEKVHAGLAYLLGLIPAIVIYLLKKDDSPYVKYHALQAALYSGIVSLLGGLLLAAQTALALTAGVGAFIGTNMIADTIQPETPGIYFALSSLMVLIIVLGLSFTALLLFFLVLFRLIAAVFTFAGRDWHFPLLGNWVEKRLEKRLSNSQRN
jgi:uncharacterized membrane protein